MDKSNIRIIIAVVHVCSCTLYFRILFLLTLDAKNIYCIELMSWILMFSLTLTFLPGVQSKEYPCEWKKRIISGPLHSNHDFCPSCPQPRILSYTVLTVFWSKPHSSYIFIIFCLSCISYSGGCVWIMHLCAQLGANACWDHRRIVSCSPWLPQYPESMTVSEIDVKLLSHCPVVC